MNGDDGFGGPARVEALPAGSGPGKHRGIEAASDEDAAAVFALLLSALDAATAQAEGEAEVATDIVAGPAPLPTFAEAAVADRGVPAQLPLLPAEAVWSREALTELRAMLMAAQAAARTEVGSEPASATATRSTAEALTAPTATPQGQPALPGAEVRPAVAGPAAEPLDLHSPRFERQLGERLIWIARQGGGDARLHVHPEQLGPIDIRIRLDADAAQVSMNATNSGTRELLEAALPRLREQFEDAGLRFAGADVSDGEHRGGSGGNGPGGNDGGDPAEGTPRTTSPLTASGSGLLDLFA